MSRRPQLLALAERVEASSREDRVAEYDVARAVGFDFRVGEGFDGRMISQPAPAYLRSLTDATSAFPPNTSYRSGHDGAGSDPSRFYCEALTEAPGCHHVRAVADTEEAARTACALRAHATREVDA